VRNSLPSARQTRPIRAIDLFCGVGGSSYGAQLAGVEIVAGFDAWDVARSAYSQNFPAAKCFGGFLERAQLKTVKKAVGRIDLLLASPECQSHSPAKGAAKRSNDSRDTALQVVRFARQLKPRWVVVENVVSMRRWRGYKGFLEALNSLGYHVREQVLDASDFGVAQTRRRLFLLCDRKGLPREVQKSSRQRRTAASIVDMNGTYRCSSLRTKKRAAATLGRAKNAMREIGRRRPFLLVYYGSDGAGGWQRLTRPLRTITTLDRFALIKPVRGRHVMRMLQVDELKRAMGMPQSFLLGEGSRRERIHLIGNAVCPPVMRALVSSLIRNARTDAES
jgi:DNA (cytosine-5)-methyltransferase 1